MIAKKYRFHNSGAVKYVLSKGKPYKTKGIGIKVYDRPQRENPRIAVIVSKKVAKQAVKRNRIRRRVFGVVEKLAPDFGPTDVVISVFDVSVLKLEQKELESRINKLFKDAKLVK